MGCFTNARERKQSGSSDLISELATTWQCAGCQCRRYKHLPSKQFGVLALVILKMIPEGINFYVILLFEHTGYYGSVCGISLEEVRQAAQVRSSKAKSLVACSLPFQGKWVPSAFNKGSMIRDVSLPEDFRLALTHLDRIEE